MFKYHHNSFKTFYILHIITALKTSTALVTIVAAPEGFWVVVFAFAGRDVFVVKSTVEVEFGRVVKFVRTVEFVRVVEFVALVEFVSEFEDGVEFVSEFEDCVELV